MVEIPGDPAKAGWRDLPSRSVTHSLPFALIAVDCEGARSGSLRVVPTCWVKVPNSDSKTNTSKTSSDLEPWQGLCCLGEEKLGVGHVCVG